MLPSYDELKYEMVAISDILKQFPEPLQNNVFNILIKQYFGGDFVISNTEYVEDNKDEAEQEHLSASIPKDEPKKDLKKEKTTPKRKTGTNEVISIVKDLDLSARNGKTSLKEFFQEKSPKTNIEINVVCAYYLSRFMNISPITVEHIYTCYKELNKPVGNLRQSLKDTSGPKYGYINLTTNDIAVPIRGDNLVEHDLPRIKSNK